ncbi:hypothetical protein SB679_26095, partial [Chryseobacterium sp. SIMBA_029]
LSLALPLPMAALLWFTCDKDLMGVYKNCASVAVIATLAALTVLSFNVVLVLQTFGFDIPGLPR